MARTAAEIASLINAYGAIGGDVSVETVAHIQQRARIQTYRPGEFVTRRGQNEPRICIVLSGVVRLTAFTEDGREMLCMSCGPAIVGACIPALADSTRQTTRWSKRAVRSSASSRPISTG